VDVLIEHRDARGDHGYSSAYDAVCVQTDLPQHGIIKAVVIGKDADTLIAKPL
jgi:hypothetical protein